MELFQIILLGIIQGLTEFLPVSSSGHLILAPLVLNFKDQGLALDAILHLGTLMAILIFFKKDLWEIFRGLFDRELTTHKLAWCIVAASLPAGLIGLFFADWIETGLRSPVFVATNLLIWSAVFYMADRAAKNKNRPECNLKELKFSQIFFIGCAQAIALLPGTSRSGITIAAGLFSNLNHVSATRFSFLLGAPIIFAAGMHKLIAFINQPSAIQDYTYQHLIVGLGTSFLVGLLAIKLLLKVVEKVGLLPFIIYRVILAVAILIYYIG
ncbi:MAG: undecaprenyl-diphosphate phosphatase [Nitrospina sp.]|jgi:undecaprenyl-diphosphatase|nr:undecaprenyl-diphosphate phosphatase [Nitrospina sp.]